MDVCEDQPTIPTWWKGMILGEHWPTSLNRGEGPRWWWWGNDGGGGSDESQDQQC